WRRVSDEDEYGEIKIIVRELIIYLLFLTVLLIAAFGEKGEIRFYYTKAMENLFIYSPAPSGRTYADMTIIADFWEVLWNIKNELET
ncbi:Polycystic kidney disease 2-like 1 protein, partial [Gryllus bimaculatus]